MVDQPSRRGFALLTVLWLLSTIGVVALAATALGRDEFNAASNRIALERATWIAEGCAAELRAVIADSLRSTEKVPDAQDRLWTRLRSTIETARFSDSTCVVEAEAAGDRLDVNTATPEQLDRLFDAAGIDGDPSSLRDALLDWIDPDDEARPSGAEADWYRVAGRRLPRNAPIADAREITRIKGFEGLASLERFISTEDPQISVATAPPTVLAAVPAFSPAIVDRILQLRAANRPINDLSIVLAGVPESDADSAMARFPEILRVTTLVPPVWIVTVKAAIRPTAPAIELEQRLARNGSGPIVMRTRVTP